MRTRAVLLAVIIVVGVAGCGGQHHGHVTVTPALSLFDKPVHIVVSHAGVHRRVMVELSSLDAHRVRWNARAVFRSNASGVVDLADSSSVAGSYGGINPMGLIEALTPASGRSIAYFWHVRQPQRFELRVIENGQTIATNSFNRRLVARGVSVNNESIAATGFYGQMWNPVPGSPRRPAVLEFGGSEGGLSGQLLGSALASAGYPTLDLAYFDEPGLPTQLKDIPLEYFARALRWLAHQPGVRDNEIYVSGASRGSEAALLLGAHYPNLVHGVIASSPSDLSFGSYPTPGSPAWTYHGRPVPFSEAFSPTIQIHDPAAEIAVQRIQGPVLLDCGTDDQIWTSCAYAQAMQRRLNADHDHYQHVLYRYIGAGHLVNSLTPYEPGFSTGSDSSGMGDTPLANLNADAQLWPHVLSFLARRAVHTGTFTAHSTPQPLTTP